MTDTHWHDLTGFQRDLLKALLALDDRMAAVSGQDIKHELEATHHVDINHGRLYPNLDTLVDAGLIDKGEIDARTNSYTPTTAGGELVRREVQSWVSLLDADRQLMADGGPRVRYCRECDSVHPVDAACKPWGDGDD